MTKLYNIKLLHSLFLTTALVSGSTLFAMGKEEDRPSTPHIQPKALSTQELADEKYLKVILPILKKNFEDAVPLITATIDNIYSSLEKMSLELDDPIYQHLKTLVEMKRDLTEFIKVSKNLTEEQMPHLHQEMLSIGKKLEGVVDLGESIKMRLAMRKQELAVEETIGATLPILTQRISKNFFPFLQGRSPEKFICILQRIQPFQNQLNDTNEVIGFLKIVEDMPEEEWSTVQKRILPFQNGENLIDFIHIVKDLTEETWNRVQQRTQVFEKSLLDADYLNDFIYSVKDLTEEIWNRVQKRILPVQNFLALKESPAQASQFGSFIKAVKDLTDVEWSVIQIRIQTFEKILQEGVGLVSFIEAVKDLSDKQWSTIQERIHAFEKNILFGEDLAVFIKSVKPVPAVAWKWIEPFCDILTLKNVTDIFPFYEEPNVPKSLYTLCKILSSFLIDSPHIERVKNWLQGEILNITIDPRIIIMGIAHTLKEEHPLTQEFIQLALGRDNQNNPNGFLAIHQEMLKKAQDPVRHTPRVMETQEGNFTLNTTLIQEPRPKGDVPFIQVALWKKLVGQYEEFAKNNKNLLQIFDEETNPSNLIKLRDNVFLQGLLDPDGMRTGTRMLVPSVSTISYEFRKIIEQISQVERENLVDAMLLLHQTLLNIQTCKTGKENGISHSYRWLKNEKILEEDLLGPERFKTEILTFFKEEFRRMREATIPQILKHLNLPSDPHLIHYVRGILGGEIGLFFKDEKISIDINGNNLPTVLRKMSKQDLLKVFYLFHKPEDEIDRVHKMLNDGSISIESKKGTILTTAILNMYFSNKDKFDKAYTVFEDDGTTPIGLTPLAAQKLLLELGFLVVIP